MIPDGKSKWGRFYELRDMVDNALKSNLILLTNLMLCSVIVNSNEESPSTAVTSLKAMYNGCMDTEAIEVITSTTNFTISFFMSITLM